MALSRTLMCSVVLVVAWVAVPGWAATIQLQPPRGPSGTMVQVHACSNPTGPFGIPAPGHFVIRLDNAPVGPPVEGAPCPGGGTGFGQGTSRLPAMVRIDGAPGTSRHVSVEFQGQGITIPPLAATFVVDPSGPAPPANPPAGQGSGNQQPPPNTSGAGGAPGQPAATPPAKIAWLDVHDVVSGGAPETEATLGLAGQGAVFHLRVRGDAAGAGHQRLLDLLVQAFSQNWTVVLTSDSPPNTPTGSTARTVTGVRVSR